MLPSLLLSLSLLGGSAEVSDAFVVHLSTPKLVAWLQLHPGSVSLATGASLIVSSGSQRRIRKDTVKGTFDFAIRENVITPGANFIYSATLTRCYEGDVAAYRVLCVITPSGPDWTYVRVESAMTIDQWRVHDLDVRIGLNQALRSFRKFMEGLR